MRNETQTPESEKAMRTAKRHNGRQITIQSNEECLDQGVKITGVYRHINRHSTFGFAKIGSVREDVFERDEWDVIKKD